MLSVTEKVILNAILENDGHLKTLKKVARATKDDGNIELIELALQSLINERYVQDSGCQNHDGRYIMKGSFWTVDDNVGPLIQGGVL